MSVYSSRTQAAYRYPATEPYYCENHHIMQWWTPDHDRAILCQIEKWHWGWYWEITDSLVAITPEDIIEIWQMVDPLCEKYAWYNVLMYFAVARAEKLGLTEAIREPEWKVCPLCSRRFNEASLPHPFVRRLGMDGLDFCSPCLSRALFDESGDDNLAPDLVLDYLRDLTDALGRVPPQGYGQGITDLVGLDSTERLEVLRVLVRKPTIARVKALFGSWLQALIEAGILEGGARRTSRGTQCLAKDGHVCLSLGEKTIDDFLFARGIAHEKEPPYPEGSYRADFEVGEVLIEYFGLAGDPDYDAKTKLKRRICRKHGVKLIAVYPRDLASTRLLERKLTAILSVEER